MNLVTDEWPHGSASTDANVQYMGRIDKESDDAILSGDTDLSGAVTTDGQAAPAPMPCKLKPDRKEKHMENLIDSKTLAIEIAKILDKKKAVDVRVLKVESLTVLTDYFVIASGTSTTQVGALADEVEFELSQKGLEPYSTEGYDSKNWVLLDYSNVIVHVFVPNTRTYYDLEHLWADGEPRTSRSI